MPLFPTRVMHVRGLTGRVLRAGVAPRIDRPWPSPASLESPSTAKGLSSRRMNSALNSVPNALQRLLDIGVSLQTNSGYLCSARKGPPPATMYGLARPPIVSRDLRGPREPPYNRYSTRMNARPLWKSRSGDTIRRAMQNLAAFTALPAPVLV